MSRFSISRVEFHLMYGPPSLQLASIFTGRFPIAMECEEKVSHRTFISSKGLKGLIFTAIASRSRASQSRFDARIFDKSWHTF